MKARDCLDWKTFDLVRDGRDESSRVRGAVDRLQMDSSSHLAVAVLKHLYAVF